MLILSGVRSSGGRSARCGCFPAASGNGSRAIQKSKGKTQKGPEEASDPAKADRADLVRTAVAGPFAFCVLTFELPWGTAGHPIFGERAVMFRRLLTIFWIVLGIALVILALSRSTNTVPVSHRVPGQGRMQPFVGAEPRSGEKATSR
jgi:hypothetical protein